MPTSLTIPKNPVYPPSMDFRLLRREGIKHLERLGSAIWTDYNEHDPGITMLEVLDYAITDLGYRTNLPATDLFALPTDRKPFFTAADILTNGPVTALDLRKIIIDIPGVRNAWVQCGGAPEVLMVVSSDARQLEEVLQAHLLQAYRAVIGDGPSASLWNAATISSLQSALVSYHQATDLNAKQAALKQLTSILFTATTPDTTQTFTSALLLYTVDHRLASVSAFLEDEIKQAPTPGKEALPQKLLALSRLLNELSISLNDYRQQKSDADNARLNDVRNKLADIQNLLKDVATSAIIPPDIKAHLIGGSLLAFLLTHALTAEAIPEKEAGDRTYNLFTPRGVYTILLEVEEMDEEEAAYLKRQVLAKLHQHRNLCEDFHPVVKVLDRAPLGICANLELSQEADANEVLANVFDALNHFLSPPVRFYTLQEMLDKYGRFQLSEDTRMRLTDAALPDNVLTALRPLAGQAFVSKSAFLEAVRMAVGDVAFADYEALIFYHTEKTYDSHPVYQGPLLEHGFLDEAELAAAQLRRTVYKSDLYQVMLQVPGVVSIENLVMDKCQHQDNTEHRILADHWCLSFNCDCVPTLDVRCSTFHYTKGNGYLKLDPVRAAQQAEMKQMERQAGVTKREKADLDLVAPTGAFREDFLDYTSVQEDFPVTYHIGREGLASGKSALRKAQAKQLKGYLLFYDQILANYLGQLAQVRELLAIDGQEKYPAGFLSLADVVPNAEPLLKDYGLDHAAFQTLMQGVTLDQQLYQSRLLDHLLARFGEQFTDYVLVLYRNDKLLDDGDLVGEGLTDWIADKQRLLEALPRLGSQRGRGFNYRADPVDRNAHVWQPSDEPAAQFSNVEGLKQRVCAMLGIADASRHTITCEHGFITEVFVSTETRAKRYQFGVKAREDDPNFLLVSTAKFASRPVAEKASQTFENLSVDASRYGTVVTSAPDQWVVAFWETETGPSRTYENALLLSPKSFDQETAEERLAALKNLVETYCQDDSFHVVEHLLLRPRDEHYGPLLTPVGANLPEPIDPYSFRISVIVPTWVERYRDPQQFYHFQQTVRLETPAHVAVSICRYNREQMLDFEKTYYQWLVESSFSKPEATDLREATNQLVKVLNTYSSQCVSTYLRKPAAPSCLPPVDTQ